MALSVFDNRETPPTDRSLAEALGTASTAWTTLKDALFRECGPLQEEWAFAGAKFGWSQRLKRGKRVIVHLTPCKDHFLASFALGEKACADAPKYAEGRGVRIPVRTERDTKAIRILAAIKLAH